eukprot:gene21267-27290_t
MFAELARKYARVSNCQPEPGEIYNNQSDFRHRTDNYLSRSPPQQYSSHNVTVVNAAGGKSRSPPPRHVEPPPPRFNTTSHQLSSNQSSLNNNNRNSASPPQCFDFANKGQCCYGSDCKYAHVASSTPQNNPRDHHLSPSSDSGAKREIAPSLPIRQIAPRLSAPAQTNQQQQQQQQRPTFSSVCGTGYTSSGIVANTAPSDLTTDVLARHNEGLQFIPGFTAKKEEIKLEYRPETPKAALTPPNKVVVSACKPFQGALSQISTKVNVTDNNTELLPIIKKEIEVQPIPQPANTAPTTQAIGAIYSMVDRGAGPVDLTETAPAAKRTSVLSSRRQTVDLSGAPPLAAKPTAFKSVGGCLQLECDTGVDEDAPSVSMTPSQGRGRSFTQPAWMTEKDAPSIRPTDRQASGDESRIAVSTKCGQFDDAEEQIPAKFPSCPPITGGANTATVLRPLVQTAPPGMAVPQVVHEIEEEVEVDYTPPSDDEEEEEEEEVKEEEKVGAQNVETDSTPCETDADSGQQAESTFVTVVSGGSTSLPAVAENQPAVVTTASALPSVVSADSVPTVTAVAAAVSPADLLPQANLPAVVEEESAPHSQSVSPVDPAHYLVPSLESVGEISGLLWYIKRNEANAEARKRKVGDRDSDRQQSSEASPKKPRVVFSDVAGVATDGGVAVVEEEDQQQQVAHNWKRKLMKQVEQATCRVT